MTKYFKATFSDGFSKNRSTTYRDYTHAWRVGKTTGFSSSEALAWKSARGEYSYLKDVTRDVTPVVEITAKEYRNK